MRIKKDKSSWRSSGIIKRDFRHDHSEGQARPQKKKGNRRKWCKGVVGQKHDYQKFDKHMFGDFRMYISKCSRCGREKWGGFIPPDSQ